MGTRKKDGEPRIAILEAKGNTSAYGSRVVQNGKSANAGKRVQQGTEGYRDDIIHQMSVTLDKAKEDGRYKNGNPKFLAEVKALQETVDLLSDYKDKGKIDYYGVRQRLDKGTNLPQGQIEITKLGGDIKSS